MTPVEYYKKLRQEYDEISPSFCVLKWHHLEMHLGSAVAHSCFHCPQYDLSLDEDFHNTKQKKAVRQEMLDGVKSDECSYCWKQEEIGITSPRITLAPVYTLKDVSIIQSTAKMKSDEDVFPKYLEMSFSNTCQFKCSYCSTQNSSSWFEEIKKHGPLDMLSLDNAGNYTLNGKEERYSDNDNPMVDKFWKWFKKAITHLHTLRVTGGEPLLNENTFKLAKFLKNHPCRDDIAFHVNSNLCVSDRRIDRLIDCLHTNSIVYASIDSWGPQAEWIRHGLNNDQFERNIEKLLSSGVKVGIMVTFCLLSIPNFHELIAFVLKMKKKYPWMLTIDTPMMSDPKHLSALILDDIMLDNLQDLVYYVQTNTSDTDICMFNSGESTKFERVYDWCKTSRFTGEELKRNRIDFVNFIDEHDRRRNTNWHTAFPELEYFYKECKQ